MKLKTKFYWAGSFETYLTQQKESVAGEQNSQQGRVPEMAQAWCQADALRESWYQHTQQPALNRTGFTGLRSSLVWLPQLTNFNIRPVSWDGGWLLFISLNCPEPHANVGTDRLFSVGLTVPNVCTTHLCSISSSSAYRFCYYPTDLNKTVTPGHSCECHCDIYGTTAWARSHGV